MGSRVLRAISRSVRVPRDTLAKVVSEDLGTRLCPCPLIDSVHAGYRSCSCFVHLLVHLLDSSTEWEATFIAALRCAPAASR
jgi:hypothetical protein